jgi:hypothetical protein
MKKPPAVEAGGFALSRFLPKMISRRLPRLLPEIRYPRIEGGYSTHRCGTTNSKQSVRRQMI